MFSYGVVYHLGFFNYFLGLGLGFAAITLTLRRNLASIALSVPFWAMASRSHPLPLAWSVGAVALLLLLDRLQLRHRTYVLGMFLALVAGASLSLSLLTFTQYRGSGTDMFGFTQLLVFNLHNIPIAVLTALLFAFALGPRLLNDSPSATLLSLPACLYYFACAVVLASPDMVVVPGIAQPLSILTLRLALPAAIAMLAWWNSAPPPRWLSFASAALSLAFFCMLYRDHNAASSFEEQLHLVVRKLPPHSRVVTRFGFRSFVDFGEHMIDRACIGHCWSYMNYEPASGQFRVRVRPDSQTAIASTAHLSDLRSSSAPLAATDLPLILVQPVEGRPGEFSTQQLVAGKPLPPLLLISPVLPPPDK
jgi:hypothetical protein